MDGVGSVADYLKKKKDAIGVKLSEDEALVTYSFQDTAPPMFGGTKTDKSSIQSLPTPAKWRQRQNMSGLAYEIENELFPATSLLQS